MKNNFRTNFVAGLLVVFPILGTIFIIKLFIKSINNITIVPIVTFLEKYFAQSYHPYISHLVIGILIILIVSLIGWAARNIIIRRFFSFWERLLLKLPMVSKIYSVIKQMSNAFLGHGRGFFKKAVLVEYPRKGIYSIGFLTPTKNRKINVSVNRELVNVFIPTTPNPTSGYLLLYPKEEIISIDMTIEEAMKFIVSGGAIIEKEKVNGN